MGKLIEKETSWERYKRTLYPNDIRIMFYLKYYEIDNLFDKSTTFFKPKFKNKEQEEIVYDLMKRVSFKRGILITLHLPSYLTYGRFSKRTNLYSTKNPEDYYFQIEQILTKFHRRLERRVFKGSVKKNDTRRIEKVSVIEGCYNSGKVNHIHSLVEIPEHLSYEEFELMIKKSHGSFYKSQNLTNWLRTQNGSDVVNKMGNSERVKPYSEPLRNLHTKKKKYKLKPKFELGKLHTRTLDTFRDYETKLRLLTYLTKEVKKDTYTVSWKNTHYRRSLYLQEGKRVKQKKSRKGYFRSKLERKYKNDVSPTSLTHFMNDSRMRRKVNLQNLESLKV